MELADAILLVTLQLGFWAYEHDRTPDKDNLLLIGRASDKSSDYGDPDALD
jgi:hypothetical protein